MLTVKIVGISEIKYRDTSHSSCLLWRRYKGCVPIVPIDSLLIQSKHPGIDFRIGEYKTSYGTDLIVEYINKGIPAVAWAEIVVTLEKLFAWSHPPEGIHKVICWELGNVGEKQTFEDGKEAKLTKKGHGRYHLDVGVDSIEVYVLREIVQEGK